MWVSQPDFGIGKNCECKLMGRSVSAIVWCVCRERRDERESMCVCGCVRECTRAQCYMCLLPSVNLSVFALGFCVLVSVLITVSLYLEVCVCMCVRMRARDLACSTAARTCVCPSWFVHVSGSVLTKVWQHCANMRHATGREDRPCSHGGLILTSWLLVWPKQSEPQ